MNFADLKEQRHKQIKTLYKSLEMFKQEISPRTALRARRRYLAQEIEQLSKYLIKTMDKINNIPEDWVRELTIEYAEIDKKTKKLRSLQQEIENSSLKNSTKPPITPEQIEQAKLVDV